MTATRRRRLPGNGAALLAALAAVFLWLPGFSGVASAKLTMNRVPGLDPCAEAATYDDEDQSPPAERARRRCRLDEFDRELAEERRRATAEREQAQERAVQAWIAREEIPLRVIRRNAVDGFLSGGLTSYGLAVSGVFLPALEAELWAGWRTRDEIVVSPDFQIVTPLRDERTCLGGRAKWLLTDRRNLTPFLSAGVAGCRSNINAYVTEAAAGTAGGKAHAVTAGGGVAFMAKSGFRVSAEYFYGRAFYAQVSQRDPMRTHNPQILQVWKQTLTNDRHGVRLQVGYAF
jgi:hypothetical protein